MCAYTNKCTNTHTGKSDSNSEIVICCYGKVGKGCHIRYDEVNKQMLVSSPKF